MIFVTATIVDPAGNRVHSDDELPLLHKPAYRTGTGSGGESRDGRAGACGPTYNNAPSGARVGFPVPRKCENREMLLTAGSKAFAARQIWWTVVIIDGPRLTPIARFTRFVICVRRTAGRRMPFSASLKMLAKLRATREPTHSIVVWDGGLSAERIARLPEYKAQRPGMPDDLKSQLDEIVHYLNAAGVASFCRAGVEADDYIACLARRARTRA